MTDFNKHFSNYGNSHAGDKSLAWKMWISKRIREERESHDCCIGMLSVLSSLTEEYIHRIETAEIIPSDVAIIQISMALGIPKEVFDPPEDLLTE